MLWRNKKDRRRRRQGWHGGTCCATVRRLKDAALLNFTRCVHRLVVFLAIGLTRNPQEVPSALANPRPSFACRSSKIRHRLFPRPKRCVEGLDDERLGLVVFSAAARSIPDLFKYAQSGVIELIGLNYKDRREDALGWLGDLGDPYKFERRGSRPERGRNSYGVYGAPETYIIDKSGTVRLKHVGRVTRTFGTRRSPLSSSESAK